MTIPRPRNGAVIHYSYLWKHEQEAGLEEGLKDRPAAVILTHEDDISGETIVFALPITHTAPRDMSVAIEISPEIKTSLGLDAQPSWVICDEVNRFLWPGYDLRPIPGRGPATWEYGLLTKGLYEDTKRLFLKCRSKRRLRQVGRD